MESQFAQVVAGYHRARETGQLFDAFYELFWRIVRDSSHVCADGLPAPEAMLRESILEMLMGNERLIEVDRESRIDRRSMQPESHSLAGRDTSSS